MPSIKRPLLAATLIVALATPWLASTYLTARAGDQAIAPISATINASDAATIMVSAQADVRIAPDVATINAGVVTQAETADAAMTDNRTKMNAVFEALKKAGIADKDMQSAGITINPQYRYAENQPPVVTGYQASNTVNVTLRDMAAVGTVIDALVSQGVNQLNGPTFDVEDKDSALNEARTKAVGKARDRAKLYAEAAGVKITRLKNLSEQSMMSPQTPYPMMRMAAMDSAASSTPVAPGEVMLSVTISMTYEIGE